jgi:hypothetical protein
MRLVAKLHLSAVAAAGYSFPSQTVSNRKRARGDGLDVVCITV